MQNNMLIYNQKETKENKSYEKNRSNQKGLEFSRS